MKVFIFLLFLLSAYKGSAADEPLKKKVVAEKGDSYNILCEYSEIDYCWFQAPNKTIYSVHPNMNLSDTHLDYEYYGHGFKNGDCGIKIKHASHTDSGEWRCNMGVSNSIDKISYINVKIHDTRLHAESDKVLIGKFANITCEIQGATPAEYCRFIRPDGRGIYPNALSKMYSNDGSNETEGRCVLVFKQYSALDLGNWTCIAKPISDIEEYYDRALVYYYSYGNGSSFMAAFFWILYILAISAIILISSLILCKLRLKASTHRNETNTPSINTSPL